MIELDDDVSNLKVELPSVDSDNWFVSKTQSLSISKDEYMLKAFNSEFPNLAITSFSQLSDLVSRSSALQDWYAIESAKYIKLVELPAFLSNSVTPAKFSTIRDSLSQYNKINSDEGKQIKALSEKFDSDLKAIRNASKAKIDKLCSDPIIRILIIKTNEMPLSLQIKINNYTPKTDDVTQSRDRYAQELLYNYQRSLIKLVDEKPDVDIEKIINRLKLK